MRAFITRWLWWGIAAASALAVGGCSTKVTAGNSNAHASPLTKSIESVVHAFSVQQVHCARPASNGRRSCQVQFTDDYGVWWATLIVKGSRVISDPGGVADWLCATACANPPAMTGNTGKRQGNTGSKVPAGQTGVTGVGGVVKAPAPPKPPKPVVTVPANTGVVTAPTNTGVVSGSGNTGVVTGTGTGIVSGSGNTGTIGATGATGIVYGTGSTGPGG
ncbi:MAG TPA: hypothetical protein VG186_04285 [Solirubrobacteraceae bacterium]|jgi:hypothetical protein|nr:hypothetical protein [Solirubrobacteraceae bacterium]